MGRGSLISGIARGLVAEGDAGYAERLRADKGVNLQARVSINTGEVVVRSIQTAPNDTEYTPIAHSTSLASRLQSLATPGSTMIIGPTSGFVDGFPSQSPWDRRRLRRSVAESRWKSSAWDRCAPGCNESPVMDLHSSSGANKNV